MFVRAHNNPPFKGEVLKTKQLSLKCNWIRLHFQYLKKEKNSWSLKQKKK